MEGYKTHCCVKSMKQRRCAQGKNSSSWPQHTQCPVQVLIFFSKQAQPRLYKEPGNTQANRKKKQTWSVRYSTYVQWNSILNSRGEERESAEPIYKVKQVKRKGKFPIPTLFINTFLTSSWCLPPLKSSAPAQSWSASLGAQEITYLVIQSRSLQNLTL